MKLDANTTRLNLEMATEVVNAGHQGRMISAFLIQVCGLGPDMTMIILENSLKVSRIVPKCPKLSQNVPK